MAFSSDYGPDFNLTVWWGDFSAFKELVCEALQKEKDEGRLVYSRAYITPAPGPYHPNHRGPRWVPWFDSVDQMLQDDVPNKLSSLSGPEAISLLKTYLMIGRFMSYQLFADLGYSGRYPWDDNAALVPGPGALNGANAVAGEILTPRAAYDMIMTSWVDRDEQSMEQTGRPAPLLWGHSLSKVDVQNIYCEYSKYARIINGGRSTRNYSSPGEPMKFKFPELWKVDIPEMLRA